MATSTATLRRNGADRGVVRKIEEPAVDARGGGISEGVGRKEGRKEVRA